MYISPFASSLFGDDEDAGEVGGRGLLAIAAHRVPPLAARGRVKRGSGIRRLKDCRAPTPELGHPKNFLKMCEAVHTTVAKHGVSVRRGRIAAVAGCRVGTYNWGTPCPSEFRPVIEGFGLDRSVERHLRYQT